MALTLPPGLITAVIEGAASAGAGLALPSIFGNLQNLFAPHVAAAATPSAPAPDSSRKTITVGWAAANPTLVALYMSAGYTIVP